MSALSEYVVTYQDTDYPIDISVWRWADEQACQRFFGRGEDEWREAITSTTDRPKAEPWARCSSCGWRSPAAPPSGLDRRPRRVQPPNAADWMRPADPDAFAAAMVEHGVTDEADPTTPSGETPPA
ncbi:MAG: hypothetical protein IPJ61_21670 [Tessaracoccus sp.]|uniref:hypothetical protein n=1 Tax=Tessaracoccus sp. TaxID=1971211 RepID=UPI001EC81B9B|nr:hypothetical protein [Tessaracoccus sp.]MBK7823599.1 hypothetical protein [Tessaracoccus sp.]